MRLYPLYHIPAVSVRLSSADADGSGLNVNDLSAAAVAGAVCTRVSELAVTGKKHQQNGNCNTSGASSLALL